MTSAPCPNRETDRIFIPLTLRNVTIRNRILRSATYEGMGDQHGFPRAELANLYTELARGGVGAIITGFVSISQTGRAMQPCQCGIDTDEKMEAWRNIVQRVKGDVPDIRLFMQLAHAGRQTRREITGLPVAGVSSRKCTYFRQRIKVLTEEGIGSIIDEFAEAASRARQAGFDGVQLHAAHGYLIHQFLSPWTNTRRDRWAERPLFLMETIRSVKRVCGEGYPVLVKLSAADDTLPGIRVEDTIGIVNRMEPLGIDAVEVSYGTMEQALNIIRGRCPVDLVLKVNPLFNRIPLFIRGIWKLLRAKSYMTKFIPFQENYNAESAARIKSATTLPIIAVGGIRSRKAIIDCMGKYDLDGVSICRPLICEPDWPLQLLRGKSEHSECTNCNCCTIYCDSRQSLRCYRRRKEIA